MILIQASSGTLGLAARNGQTPKLPASCCSLRASQPPLAGMTKPINELDKHFESIMEAWSFAIRWRTGHPGWSGFGGEQREKAGAPFATPNAEPFKGEPKRHYRPD